MRLAILADIHGNIHALQAVAAKLEQLQPDVVIVNGDIINAIPFSNQVVDFLRATDWSVIRGNHEFYYLDYVAGRAPESWNDAERWGQLHWLTKRLRPENGNYLAALPDDMTYYYPQAEPIRITHGTPGNNRMGFVNRTPDEDILNAIRDISQTTFVNAHSHVQIDRLVREENGTADRNSDPLFFLEDKEDKHLRKWHVVNPGSVGLPLNGDPRAQFAILESVSPGAIPGGWRVSHYRVSYDRRPALEAYTTSGMIEAGGVISELFYWELVTAQREIPYFFLWKRANLPPDGHTFREEFEAYKQATGRESYILQKDPLRGG